jgi:hypothetical protein
LADHLDSSDAKQEVCSPGSNGVDNVVAVPAAEVGSVGSMTRGDLKMKHTLFGINETLSWLKTAEVGSNLSCVTVAEEPEARSVIVVVEGGSARADSDSIQSLPRVAGSVDE